jgi:hypothetical protein
MISRISSKIFAILIAAALTIGISSCTKTDPVSPDSSNNNPFIPEYVSAGTQVDDLVISEPTVDQPAIVQNAMESERMQLGMQFCEREPQFQFTPIFRDLKLTPEQLDSIKVFMREHNECQRIARAEYYNAIMGFVDSANTQRRAVLDSLRQGLLDRTNAVQRLKQINREMRLAIQNSGALETLRTALQGCTETLFANIRSILNADQLAKWDRWVENHNGPKPGNGWGRGRDNGRG